MLEATVGFGGIDCLSCDKFGTISSALTNSNCNVSTPSWQAINGTGFGWYVEGGLSLKEHCGGGDILTVFSTSMADFMVFRPLDCAMFCHTTRPFGMGFTNAILLNINETNS